MSIMTTIGGLIPGPIGWAIKIFAGGKSLVGKAFGWVTENATHMLIAALIAVGIWGFLGHRSATKWHQSSDKAVAMLATEQLDNATCHASLKSTTDALSDQNNAVTALGAASTAKQQAAQTALKAAVARSQASLARASAIEADAARGASGVAQPATPAVVMDAAKAGDF